MRVEEGGIINSSGGGLENKAEKNKKDIEGGEGDVRKRTTL